MSATLTPGTPGLFHSRTGRYAVALLAVATIAMTGATASNFTRSIAPDPVPSAAEPVFQNVSALGTLEPKSRIVKLAAPTSLDGARVEQLLVAEGDWVDSGALVATLDTLPRRRAAHSEALSRVAVAQARLNQVAAGSRPGDIASAEAALACAETTAHNADQELRRAAQLLERRALSVEEYEKRSHQAEAARHEIERARGRLDALREVRDVDVKHAQAEIESAAAAAERAKAELDAAHVRSPFAGRILKVVARPGERVGDAGIVELGDTSEMDAVAEVYEADLPRVCVGQSARVRIPSLNAQLIGTVVGLGQRVARRIVFDNDPVADTDARVVEVRIRLDADAGERVAGLSNARVSVVIESSRGE